MPLSPPPSDWPLVSLFALSSFIFFLFCHFFVHLRRKMETSPATPTPPTKQGLDPVSNLEFPHSSDVVQSEEESVLGDGDLTASGTFVDTKCLDSETNGGERVVVDHVRYSVDFDANEAANVIEKSEEEAILSDGDFIVSAALIDTRSSESNGLVHKKEEEIAGDHFIDSVDLDRTESAGTIMNIDMVSADLGDSFPITLGITDDKNNDDSELGLAEPKKREEVYEEDDDVPYVKGNNNTNNNASSVKFPGAEEEILKIEEEPSSSSACVLQPAEHESNGIMEDYDVQISVCRSSDGVLQPEESESKGIKAHDEIQTSVCKNSSSDATELNHGSHSSSMAFDLENLTELHHDSPPSMASDLENSSELHCDSPPSLASDLKNVADHEYHASKASDLENLRTEELKSQQQHQEEEQLQAFTGSENSKDQFNNSVAEIAQVRGEESIVSREDAEFSVEEDKDGFAEIRRTNDKDIEISQPTKYQHIFSVPPYSLKRTSWRSCCGLLDVLRSYK